MGDYWKLTTGIPYYIAKNRSECVEDTNKKWEKLVLQSKQIEIIPDEEFSKRCSAQYRKKRSDEKKKFLRRTSNLKKLQKPIGSQKIRSKSENDNIMKEILHIQFNKEQERRREYAEENPCPITDYLYYLIEGASPEKLKELQQKFKAKIKSNRAKKSDEEPKDDVNKKNLEKKAPEKEEVECINLEEE